MITYRVAKYPDDKAQLRALSKRDPLIDPFNRPEYSNAGCYERGSIRVAEENGKIIGFTCCNHKKREPTTVLYFMMVDEEHRRQGIGEGLILDMIKHSPSMRVHLHCNTLNTGALSFYKSLGFTAIAPGLGGTAWLMEKRIKANVQDFM